LSGIITLDGGPAPVDIPHAASDSLHEPPYLGVMANIRTLPTDDETDALLKLMTVALRRYKAEPETRHLSGPMMLRTAEVLNKAAGK
jgi:hypothetical protein